MPQSPNNTCNATIIMHCCYYFGSDGICEFFDSTIKGNKFCSLRDELGTWDAVYADPRYAHIKAALESHGSVLCGDWPTTDEQCNACGMVG